jgi:hypothetical protein
MKPDRPAPGDWRRQGQEAYLHGATLSLDRYRPSSETSDHDHCEFCWERFSLNPGDTLVGYRTSDHYRWICDRCFEDFRAEFEWVVASL